MKLQSILLAMSLLVVPVAAFANVGWDCGPGNLESNTCAQGTISRIEQSADGSFIINFATVTAGSMPFCAAVSTWWQNNAYIRAGSVTGVHGSTTVTVDGVKAFLANLLSAKLTGRTVSVYTLYSSATDQCVVGAIDLF